MSLMFAICVPETVLQFLKYLYPYKEVTKDKVSRLMDLICEDILRVQDPKFHSPAQIVAGTNYKEEKHMDTI